MRDRVRWGLILLSGGLLLACRPTEPSFAPAPVPSRPPIQPTHRASSGGTSTASSSGTRDTTGRERPAARPLLRCPTLPAGPTMPLEVFPPHHRLEVGDKLAIALRPKDTVRHPTQVLATLHRPDGSVLQATTRLDPRRAVEVFQGCDPVRGIPDSCKDGPRRTIMTGGGDVTVIFRGDPLILPEPGTYRIDFCGVDGRIDAEPVTFRIGRDPFAYLFPRGNVAGFRPIERQIFRSDPAHPRYQITYVLDEKTSPDARPTIDVIIAPFPDAATARREMNRIAAWGHPIRTFQSGIEVFENDGTYRIRWVTHAAFVHLETHNLSLPEARRFTDHLLTHHPIATR